MTNNNHPIPVQIPRRGREVPACSSVTSEITTRLLVILLSIPFFFSFYSFSYAGSNDTVSDEEFLALLMQREFVSAPVYLGCNLGTEGSAGLPLNCEFGPFRYQFDIREVVLPEVEFGEAVRAVSEADWWEPTFQAKELEFFSWGFAPRWKWRPDEARRATLCVSTFVTEPSQDFLPVFNRGECILVFDSTEYQAPRVLQLRFNDYGELGYLAARERGDIDKFHIFVAFVAKNVSAGQW